MRFWSRFRSFAAVLAWPVLCWVAAAVAPKLLPPSVTPDRVTLQLQGESGQSYRLEASTNLISWFPVGSGIAQAGGLTLQHVRPTGQGAIYYRALLSRPVASFPTVVPVPDALRLVSSVVTPEQEVVLRLETAERVVYRLRMPTNSVLEPTLVTLTALKGATGIPTQAGLLAGVRIEPSGLVPLSPLFLEIDFPTNLPARQISSFACENSGANLHLVPDVVVANGATNRVRLFTTQFGSYGCSVFTLAELQALASTAPPVRVTAARMGQRALLEECYPNDERDAQNLEKKLEDLIRPRQQEAAAILGTERQSQLLGTTSEDEGQSALFQLLASDDSFFRQEIESHLPEALQKCAVAQTLVPWALSHDRQRQLLGDVSEGASSTSVTLMCQGAKRCREQALECCRTHGGDTRLIQQLLGLERQRQLSGFGEDPRCGAELTVDQIEKECAPEWYGTLNLRIRGDYKNVSTNGDWRTQRTMTSDLVVTATVLSAKVERNAANIFFPAYTNIVCVLGGRFVASDNVETLKEYWFDPCNGLPSERHRNVFTSSLSTNFNNISLEAVILAPGTGNLFISPSLTISGEAGNRGIRSLREDQQTRPSSIEEHTCVTTTTTSDSFEPDGGLYGFLIQAKEHEFTATPDLIRYTFHGPEPMQFDFEHEFDGVRDATLELHRVR